MRVGILTSGGDCQALNATMRGLALTLYRNVKDVEIIGFIDGYKGLMYEKYKKMKPKDFYDILNVGGSILGNSRCPFKRMRIIENGFDKVKAMKNTYKKLELEYIPRDKEMVLAWDDEFKYCRALTFYNAKDKCTIEYNNGKLDGYGYDHYAPATPENIEQFKHDCLSRMR